MNSKETGNIRVFQKKFTIFPHLRQQSRSISSNDFQISFNFIVHNVKQDSRSILEYNHIMTAAHIIFTSNALKSKLLCHQKGLSYTSYQLVQRFYHRTYLYIQFQCPHQALQHTSILIQQQRNISKDNQKWQSLRQLGEPNPLK